MLKKAEKNDFDCVMAIYNEVLSVEDNRRYSNWQKGLYPTEDTAQAALASGTLYFYIEDGVIKGSVILDGTLPEDYSKIAWRFNAPNHKILSLHTLCIKPEFTGRGCGSRLLKDIENFGRENGYEVMRFDTHNDNLPAQGMYKKNGYSEAGAAYVFVYGKVRLLRCFEKQL